MMTGPSSRKDCTSHAACPKTTTVRYNLTETFYRTYAMHHTLATARSEDML